MMCAAPRSGCPAKLVAVHCHTTVLSGVPAFSVLLKAGRLQPVELLGSVRVRRADVEALACPLAQEIRSPKTEIRGQLEGVAR